MDENEETRDWSIQEIARLAGTTSRTLRHYGAVGLLEPTRIGPNGYRYYDGSALARLQRILLLRDLGLGIPAIAQVLEGQRDDADALSRHLGWLRQEQHRLDRQVASVQRTITRIREGRDLMAGDMFDGFDHAQYRAEVEERWGAESWERSARWFSEMGEEERSDWLRAQKRLITDWVAASEAGLDPAGTEAEALADRQARWLADIPGTPAESGRPTREYFIGLGEMYVADGRFTVNYGGTSGAEFVRDAMASYARKHLAPSVE